MNFIEVSTAKGGPTVKKLTWLALIFVAAALLASPVSPPQEVEYRGAQLEGEVFLCTSDLVTTAGFLRDPSEGKVTQVTGVFEQENVTTWRITLRDSEAEVVAFQGATQTLEAAERFAVRRGPLGVLLTMLKGTSSQTIAIDLSNSSFVYSAQNLHMLMNKTSTFVGSCRPYAS